MIVELSWSLLVIAVVVAIGLLAELIMRRD